MEAWRKRELVGLLAVYLDDLATGAAFISNISVLPDFRRQGISNNLMRQCAAQAAARGIARIALEVGNGNARAIKLYAGFGFTLQSIGPMTTRMQFHLQPD